LFTSTDTSPSASRTPFTYEAIWSTSRMSHVPACTVQPRAASWAFAVSSFAASRPAMATFAPSSHSVRAMASPMPLPPPVTMATCPSKRPGRKMLGMSSR
jgi:hypothetical protein